MSALPRRPQGDFYATPPQCTEALLDADRPPTNVVWEPACGNGAISRVLAARGHHVFSTDLHARGFGESGVDFLTAQSPYDGPYSIVTNPPFNLADAFARRALELPDVEYVAILHRLAWLEGARRHAELWQRDPPTRIWVFSARQTLWRGDDPNPRSSGGATAYAWFVWHRRARGKPPRLGWLQTPARGRAAP